MDLDPPALTPSTATFFDQPTDLRPVDKTRFLSINGNLVLILPIRNGIRKELIYLCSPNSNPVQSDLTKQTHVLCYLKSCPDLGSTFSTNPTAYPDGVTITAAPDPSYACHADGRSHSAYMIRIGHNTAPFITHSASETSAIALSPCEAEYLALGQCAQHV